MQWANIPDISEVAPLSETDRQCFREIRDVLEKFGCLDRFGINLIHKHFPMAEDEVLVETIDAETRTLTIKPLMKAAMPASIETQWQLTEGAALLVCHGYCVSGGGHPHYHTPV